VISWAPPTPVFFWGAHSILGAIGEPLEMLLQSGAGSITRYHQLSQVHSSFTEVTCDLVVVPQWMGLVDLVDLVA